MARFTKSIWIVKNSNYQLNGTFIDGGNQISSVTIEDLKIDYSSSIIFRFEVPKETANCGGFTLFGEDFGDHNQAIRVKAFYEETNID